MALRVASHVPCKWNAEMLSCFALTWEFSPFSCKAEVEQAVVRAPQQGWNTRLVHCHPFSLVMAGDTRATCSHTIYPAGWVKMLPVWAWRIDFSCDSSPAFPLGSELLSLL